MRLWRAHGLGKRMLIVAAAAAAAAAIALLPVAYVHVHHATGSGSQHGTWPEPARSLALLLLPASPQTTTKPPRLFGFLTTTPPDFRGAAATARR